MSMKPMQFSWWGKVLLVVAIAGFWVTQQFGQWLYDSSRRRGGADLLGGILVILPTYLLVAKIKRPSMTVKELLALRPMDGDAAVIGLIAMEIANVVVGIAIGLARR